MPTPTPSSSPTPTALLKNKICARFAQFWQAYPKKRSRGQAEKAFAAISPDQELLEVMIAAIQRAKESKDWQKVRPLSPKQLHANVQDTANNPINQTVQ